MSERVHYYNVCLRCRQRARASRQYSAALFRHPVAHTGYVCFDIDAGRLSYRLWQQRRRRSFDRTAPTTTAILTRLCSCVACAAASRIRQRPATHLPFLARPSCAPNPACMHNHNNSRLRKLRSTSRGLQSSGPSCSGARREDVLETLCAEMCVRTLPPLFGG
jgi:hypothetical protein